MQLNVMQLTRLFSSHMNGSYQNQFDKVVYAFNWYPIIQSHLFSKILEIIMRTCFSGYEC